MRVSGRQLNTFAWGLSLGVSLVAFFAWGEGLRWRLDGLSSYKLFPLFGLLAFSLMWGHYIISALRRYTGLPGEVTKTYFESTSWAVLALIVFHPGLLIWQLWRDGFGLPPESYLRNYIAPGLEWAAFLGTVSLLIFLAYELHRWYRDRSWWRFVGYGSDLAMILILIHSLELGHNLQRGWLHTVWLLYGLSYLIALIYIHLSPKKSVS